MNEKELAELDQINARIRDGEVTMALAGLELQLVEMSSKDGRRFISVAISSADGKQLISIAEKELTGDKPLDTMTVLRGAAAYVSSMAATIYEMSQEYLRDDKNS